ncbi:MAG: hypothetical protein JWM58_4012 [Rhizobium sp.]|nr:hypothetical protein [Rhizobium sp.]
MRQDAQNRIMSLSFKRLPEEQADVLLGAGRRFLTGAGTKRGRNILVGAVAFGIMVGLGMEIYRRFVLSPLLGVDEVTPLNIIILQLLPFLILLAALIFAMSRQGNRRQRQALIDRIEPDIFIDIDIFRDGLRSTAGALTMTMDWAAVRSIDVRADRIEFEGETLTAYIPKRSFADRQAFEAAAAQLRTLWLDAAHRRGLAQAERAAPESGREVSPPRH